jgi:hypothetical protein
MVSPTNPLGCILGFLDQSRYFFSQVAPQLCSRGRAGPVPDPLLLRKSGNAFSFHTNNLMPYTRKQNVERYLAYTLIIFWAITKNTATQAQRYIEA